VFAENFAARGMAIGDFTNSGAVDVLISVNGGAPLLLKNRVTGNHWLGVKLVGKKSNPDAIGAKLTWTAGTLKRSQLKVGGGSYLSSHDPRVVMGLGANTRVDKLEIQWPLPSGRAEMFKDLAVDRYITIVEGEGIVER
jgi:enediyne biosynthesis protein E4